jgi:hypothetical protein
LSQPAIVFDIVYGFFVKENLLSKKCKGYFEMLISNRMKIYSICLACFLFAANAHAALTVSASTINVAVGTVQAFTIGGGTGYYNVISDNDLVAIGSVSGSTGSSGEVKGLSIGSATLTIEDSGGQTATIAVVVTNLGVSESQLSLTVNESKTVTVSSGSGFYTVVSNDDAVATASISNGVASVTGVAPGSAIITVTDSNSDSATIDVVVGSSFSVSPSSVTLAVGGTVTSDVSDKTASYDVSSSDDAVATASIDNGVVTIEGKDAGSAVITVTDKSSSNSATIDVVVGSSLSVSPSSVTLAVGGSATCDMSDKNGFYSVASSDDAVATASIFNGVVTVVGVDYGTAVITVTSSVSTTATISVVVPADFAVDLFFGNNMKFDLTGGSGFYKATIADSSIAGVSFSGDLAEIKGLIPGKTDISITDSDSNAINIGVTVRLATPVVSMDVAGTDVKLSWEMVNGADSYFLFYAANDADGNPILTQIEAYDAGNVLSLDVTLSAGLSYSVAIQAIYTGTPVITSDVSNVETFIIK